jgi:predicted AlkP superfamily pyrophosphatase or phosphodiesterase
MRNLQDQGLIVISSCKYIKINTMRYLSLLCFSFLVLQLNAQKQVVPINASSKPKLVVGIVVDQMRWDYVNKFKPYFKSKNGFLHFVNEGATCDNTIIPYVPTVTACGHTCVYTGSVPALHGIAGNMWYDNVKMKQVYCVEDATVQAVGTTNNAAGQMSPVNVWTSTIGDELKLATNFKSKVIGVSLKDRGAIIPAGHAADAAYWYDTKSGNFISSTYYAATLPSWLTNYNNAHHVDSLYSLGWKLSLANSVYENNCDADENVYESTPFGKDAKHMPYDLSSFIGKDYSKIASTPQGNNLVIDIAKQALLNEKMGADSITDLLAVSFSSPDYIGHSFGPNSWETLDGYVKLDEILADFFNFLDKQVGKDNYTVFLTADHAVANIPAFAKKHNLPGENYDDGAVKNDIIACLSANNMNPKLVSFVGEYNIYFNHPLMDSLHINNDSMVHLVSSYLEKKPQVLQVVESRKAAIAPLPQMAREKIVNGFNAQRGGDLILLTKSGVVDGYPTGTSHGVLYNYDAHIPFLLVGKGIKHGVINTPTYMTDIAPTITTLLGIQMPSGSIGKPVLEVLK